MTEEAAYLRTVCPKSFAATSRGVVGYEPHPVGWYFLDGSIDK